MFRRALLFLPAVLLAGCQVEDSSSAPASPAATAGPGAGATPTTGGPSIAFVTNQIADFWKIAEAGCVAASKEFGLEVQVIMPPEASAVVQKQKVEISADAPAGLRTAATSTLVSRTYFILLAI